MKLKCRYVKPKYIEKKISDSFCLYSSSDFANMPTKIAKANRSGGTKVKVIGKNLPRITDWTIEFEGEWRNSAKFGYTFFADSHTLLKPETNRGTVKFLSSKAFPGIGEVTAQAIVDEFGDKTLDVLEHNPELLLRVKGLNLDKIGTISECYQQNVSLSNLTAYLCRYGVSNKVINRINDMYGKASISQIEANPYSIQDIAGVGFKTCETIARSLKKGDFLASYQRIEGAIKEVIKQHCEQTGDMCYDYETFEIECLKVLNDQLDPNTVTLDNFRNSIKIAANKKVIVFRGKKYIYLKEYDDAEENVARNITSLRKISVDFEKEDVEHAIDDYCKNNSSMQLSAGQLAAIKTSLLSKISVITGGAGTGKTTVVKAIASIFSEFEPDTSIVMLAPTGKAARRITEATGYEAHTIHSKLMLSEDFTRPTPIEDALIIVDESSMIDNLLMDKLMSSITLNSHVVFVGDINQLPSVGSGSVLAEMIKSNTIPVSALTDIFRQKDGGVIVENSNAVNNGIEELKFNDSFQLLVVDNEEKAVSEVSKLYTKETNDFGIDNVALLTPLRRTQNKYTCVSDYLNRVIQERVNPLSSDSVSIVFGGIEYRKNDRVMQWKNTPKSSNGDVGVITGFESTDNGVLVCISWENGNDTKEDREAMENIKLAYSFSIHKSQGSEYDCCIIPLITNQICQSFKRNLLYTAISRCKKKCIIVTTEEKAKENALKYCISHSDTNMRATFLAKRMQRYV